MSSNKVLINKEDEDEDMVICISPSDSDQMKLISVEFKGKLVLSPSLFDFSQPVVIEKTTYEIDNVFSGTGIHFLVEKLNSWKEKSLPDGSSYCFGKLIFNLQLSNGVQSKISRQGKNKGYTTKIDYLQDFKDFGDVHEHAIEINKKERKDFINILEEMIKLIRFYQKFV